jgi:hypothetical protein
MAELGNSYYVGTKSQLSPADMSFTPLGTGGSYATFSAATIENEIGGSSAVGERTIPVPVIRPAVLVVFRMRARDPDCAQLSYRYWNVSGEPDYAAAYYTGPKCGVNPLVEVTVMDNTTN